MGFPGIFNSIGSFTKRVIHHHFDAHGNLPDWYPDIGPAVEDLMKRVDQYTAFIEQHDDLDAMVKELQVWVLSRVSQISIIFGYGAQKKKARKILERLMKALPKSYGAEIHETRRSITAFIGRLVEGELEINLPFES